MKIIDCPNCSQKLRVPAGLNLDVTCPRCKHVFEYSGDKCSWCGVYLYVPEWSPLDKCPKCKDVSEWVEFKKSIGNKDVPRINYTVSESLFGYRYRCKYCGVGSVVAPPNSPFAWGQGAHVWEVLCLYKSKTLIQCPHCKHGLLIGLFFTEHITESLCEKLRKAKYDILGGVLTGNEVLLCPLCQKKLTYPRKGEPLRVACLYCYTMFEWKEAIYNPSDYQETPSTEEEP